jgi:hypothetical protein
MNQDSLDLSIYLDIKCLINSNGSLSWSLSWSIEVKNSLRIELDPRDIKTKRVGTIALYAQTPTQTVFGPYSESLIRFSLSLNP